MSGRWYPCSISGHVQCEIDNENDAPFAVIHTHFGDSNVEFAEYYTCSETKPTRAQFETLMDWCIARNKSFEYITDCWNLPWEDWRA